LEEEVIAGVAGEVGGVGVGVVVGIGRGLEDERRKRRLVCLILTLRDRSLIKGGLLTQAAQRT
jgi:hypothetical protein